LNKKEFLIFKAKTSMTDTKKTAKKVAAPKAKTTTKKVATKKVAAPKAKAPKKPKAPKKTKKALALEKENAEISEMAAKIAAVALSMKESAKTSKSKKTEKAKKREEENDLTDEIFNKSLVKKSRPAIKVRKITPSSLKREKNIKKSGGIKKKLTVKQLREYEEKLKVLRQTYQEQTKRLSKDSFSNNEIITAEDGTAAFDRQFSLGLASSEGEVLFEIDEALIRIGEKSYGTCEDCSCMIEQARLDALAFARSCIKCQAKKERDAGIHYKPKM
jgi:RNA polymerase-binding transcription factor DksA